MTAPGPNMSLEIPPLPHCNFALFHSPHVGTLQLRLPKHENCVKPGIIGGAEKGDGPEGRLHLRETQAGELDLPPQRLSLGSPGCS